MMRPVFFILLSVSMALAAPAKADPFLGSDDPAFVAALERWLTTDDPFEVYRQIGQLAVSGNIAAQHFANQISGNPGWFDPDRAISREERRSLFPPAAGDTRTLRFRPYVIPPEAAPGLDARLQISAAPDFDNWRDLAEILLENGYRASFLMDASIAAAGNRPFDIEAIEFAADHFTSADQRSFDFWAALLIEVTREEILPEESRHERWQTSPSEHLIQTGYYDAIEAGVWSAIRAGAFGSLIRGERPQQSEHRTEFAAMERLYEATWQSTPGSAADLELIGRLIIENRDQSPYLLPLFRVCSRFCPETEQACVATGAVDRFFARFGVRMLEPLVDPQSYFASERAVDEVLAVVSSRADASGAIGLPIPQCLLDALP